MLLKLLFLPAKLELGLIQTMKKNVKLVAKKTMMTATTRTIRAMGKTIAQIDSKDQSLKKV